MHDNHVFSTKKEMVKTSKSTKIITNSQQKMHNTTRINYCEPERDIRFGRLIEQTNSCIGTLRSTWRW